MSATVSLKGLTPNADYEVRLAQGDADCFTIDGTITTNGQGNGTIHVSEPSVSTFVYVVVYLPGEGDSYQTYLTEAYQQ